MEKYKELVSKFLDKGYIQELHWLAIKPPLFELGKTLGTKEEQYQTYLKAVKKVYEDDWDYWNAWIDRQFPKF